MTRPSYFNLTASAVRNTDSFTSVTPSLDAVILDLDGPLVDSAPGICLACQHHSRDSVSPPFQTKAAALGYLLRSEALDSRRVLMVGDSCEELNAARTVGVDFLRVSYGCGIEGLRAALTTTLLNSLWDLIPLVCEALPLVSPAGQVGLREGAMHANFV
jgi:phosphoglycolate phosphatase-like HAD superfamily hydrolase